MAQSHKLPGLLKRYIARDYKVQKRASFMFYLNISLLFFVFISAASTTYLDILNPTEGVPNYEMLFIFLVLFVSYILCLCLLVKGRLIAASNITIAISLLSVWGMFIVDENDGIIKLDTIVFIFAILSMLPLVINSRKHFISLYFIINIAIFVAIITLSRPHLAISNSEFRDYMVDNITSFIIMGVVTFYVFSIYNSALNDAKNEIEHRKEVENELRHHKENLEKLVNEKTLDLQTMNSDLQASNEELSATNEIIRQQQEKLEQALVDLRTTQAHLIQTEKMAALGILTSGVAHEINNPLNFIMGATIGLESYFAKYPSLDDNKTNLIIKGLNEGTSRISNIVKGLNEFSRDNGKFDEYCDIHTILENCFAMLFYQLKDKTEVSKQYSSLNPIVSGNVGKLHQAFINILLNAAQAIETGGQIRVTTQIQHNTVVIEVVDNGHGITQENLSKITDPFFTTKNPGQGIGLGLSITYSIINDHNGTIQFESEPQKGTKVSVTLPVIQSTETA